MTDTESNKNITEIFASIRRHKKLAILVGGFFAIVTTLVALLWPPVYESSSTILIQSQEIPTDFVRTTITSFATQRIQVTSQKAMTRTNLVKIIDEFDLYAAARKKQTLEVIVSSMRQDIDVEMITADVIDPRSGRPGKAAIAFTLSYRGDNPKQVQQVATKLTSLYLNENIKTRTEEAGKTYEFLTEEAERLKEQLAELHLEVADFKKANPKSLPRLTGMNQDLRRRAESNFDALTSSIQLMEDRKFYVESQLALLSPYGEAVDNLPRMKTLLTQLSAQYSDSHPDLIRLRRQVAALEQEKGDVDLTPELRARIGVLEKELAVAQKQYSENHPDVTRLTRMLSAARIELKELPVLPKIDVSLGLSDINPDNPAYLSLHSQLAGINRQLKVAGSRLRLALEKLEEYEQRILDSPDVEREFSAIVLDLQGVRSRYQETKFKQMKAKIAQTLESESKGERFLLIDPPQYPEAPVQPNRPFIFIFGFVISLGLGIGAAFFKGSMDKTIRGMSGVVRIFDVAPLAIVPQYVTYSEVARKTQFGLLKILTFIGVAIAVVLAVHFLWHPLDVLWFRGLRYLDVNFSI